MSEKAQSLIIEELYDKNGIRIQPFDLLKIFHFVGKNRKRHYMYKHVRLDHLTGMLYGDHLTENGAFPLRSIAENKVLVDAEIVQGLESCNRGIK